MRPTPCSGCRRWRCWPARSSRGRSGARSCRAGGHGGDGWAGWARPCPLRSWGDLLGAPLHFDKERNASAVFQSTTPQASILGGFWQAQIAVVDGKIGLPQLRGQTLGLLQALAVNRQDVQYVSIYSLDPTRAAGQD